MKRYIFAAVAVAMTMTACTNDNEHVTDGSLTVEMTFNVQGDFTLSTHPMTRTLTADGKDMTDVWLLDYVGGGLQQQLHQTSSDADFGTPTLSLGLGDHHIYFVASRSTGATLDTESHTMTFAKVLDTFWADYAVTVSSGTSGGSRSVALDRVATKLKVTFTDAIPSGAAKFVVAPETWYYGFDYMTGEPTGAITAQAITVNIPSGSIGVAGESINIFGFSSAAEWTTDVAVECKDGSNGVLGSATLTAVPFRRNRVSEFTGPLFGDNGGMTLTLNTAWDDSYTGTW